MKGKRHVVKVMRPPNQEQGENAKVESVAQVVSKDVPCSIDQLTAREAERMSQMYAGATLKVGMYGNPDKPIKTTYHLIDEFGKQLNIIGINDPSRNQSGKIELMCGEEVA